jgi:hypothetical protein
MKLKVKRIESVSRKGERGSQHEQLRGKLEEMSDLVSEHEESRRYQNMGYHVVKTDPNHNLFALYRKSDGKQLVAGRSSKILSYMNLRSIDRSNVYFDKRM